ncbi:MAG TPA: BsuPI-related putative proteinase inhibitor [Bryobacteraceae bacterium]|nr:BsuPI-related putative proteinase inhibitor [Bryobacteraceae bacterium]
MIKTKLTCFLLTTTLLAAADLGHYLPLEPGNQWTYREAKTGAEFTIRVATPALIADNVYHRLTGYTTHPLWVRFTGDGLVYRNEEKDMDAPLTLFTQTGGGWFQTPFRECDQEGQVSERPVGYTGPAGAFAAALQIRYRSFNCADAGTEEEIYQPAIGMLRRVTNSIAGPRQYDLISARIGKLRLDADPGGSYRVSVRPGVTPEVAFIATLRLSVDQTIRLRKPVAQHFDLALKNEAGRTIWRWSEGKVFPPAIEERELFGDVTHRVEIPAAPNGEPLDAGKYVIEAWYTSGDDRIQFSAATTAERR